MRNAIPIASALAANLLAAVPAHAAGSTPLPEPGTLTLLSLGVAGLLIGRKASRKPPRD